MTFTEIQAEITTRGIQVDVEGLPPLPEPTTFQGAPLHMTPDAKFHYNRVIGEGDSLNFVDIDFAQLRQENPGFYEATLAYRIQYFDRMKAALARHTRKTLADKLREQTHYRKHNVGALNYEIPHPILTEVLAALDGDATPEPEALTRFLVRLTETRDMALKNVRFQVTDGGEGPSQEDIETLRGIQAKDREVMLARGQSYYEYFTFEELNALLNAHGR